MKGFKQFMMRGNVVDLAVAVVMGAAFGAVVTAFGEGPDYADHRGFSRQAGFFKHLL